MWKAWLAQSDNSVVVEALDASQDARLRLILAALILLFGIAITLIILALSRNRKSFVASRPTSPKDLSVVEKTSSPILATDNQKKASTSSAHSRETLKQGPGTSSQAEPKPLEQKILSSQKSGQEKPKQVQASARAGMQNEKISRISASSQTARPGSKPTKTEESAFSTPSSESKDIRPFDPEEYKKELARMDPEKKRQEILQRLAEIQKDKKNAEARANIRLPSVTAAPRSMPTMRPEPTIPVSSQAKTQPASHDSQPSLHEKSPNTDNTSTPEINPQAPAINIAESAQTAEVEIPIHREGKKVQTDKLHTPQGPENPQKSATEPGTEDFSVLSSIQKKLTNPPPRMAFRDWLRKIERED
jgi:hypothetical protein